MGLNYRKQITIFPGVKLNISKSGLSVSVGKKGAHVTAGTSGRKSVSVGLPGTGLSYTKSLSKGTKRKSLGIGFTAIVIGGAIIAAVFSYKDKIGGFFKGLSGGNTAVETSLDTDAGTTNTAAASFVINTSTKKFHRSDCRYATGDNVKTVNKTRDQLIKEGYEACKTCKP